MKPKRRRHIKAKPLDAWADVSKDGTILAMHRSTSWPRHPSSYARVPVRVVNAAAKRRAA